MRLVKREITYYLRVSQAKNLLIVPKIFISESANPNEKMQEEIFMSTVGTVLKSVHTETSKIM